MTEVTIATLAGNEVTDLDPTEHGTRSNRKLSYEPSFIVRGLSELNVKLTPATTLASA